MLPTIRLMKQSFHRFNQEYFQGSLPTPEFKISKSSKLYGYCRRVCITQADGTGEMVLPCEHDSIRLTDLLQYFFVTDNGKTMLVSNSGKQLTPQMLDKFYGTTNGIIPVAAKGKLGLFDTSSGLFVEPAYDDIEIEFDQPVIAYKDGVPGYLNAEDGHFLPKEEYDNSDSDECIIYS